MRHIKIVKITMLARKTPDRCCIPSLEISLISRFSVVSVCIHNINIKNMKIPFEITVLVCNASARYSAPRAVISLCFSSSVMRVCIENRNRHQKHGEEELLYCFLAYQLNGVLLHHRCDSFQHRES